MNEVLFMLPNGQLSNGQRVAKMTKAQMKIVRYLSKIAPEQRDAIVQFAQVLQENPPVRHFGGLPGKKLVSRDSRLD